MIRRKLNGQGIDLLYPDTTPTLQRLPNGDVLLPSGDVLPSVASCPPGQTWGLRENACVPSPGAENVNFQCGGTLAPWGQNGCVRESGIQDIVQAPPVPVVQGQLFAEQTDRYQLWSSCHPVAPSLDEWLANLPKCEASSPAAAPPGSVMTSTPLGAFGCLLVGLALIGAATDVLGSKH